MPPSNNNPRQSPVPKPPKTVPKRYGEALIKLEHLRSLVKEVCRVYISNVERDILEIIDLVDALSRCNVRQKKASVFALREAMSILDQLSLKPEKGRRGDLKKIEKALRAMRQVFSKSDKN